MSIGRKRTKTQQGALAQSLAAIEALEEDWELCHRLLGSIPPGWRTLQRRCPTMPPKVKLTLALDADMVAWYRGYQPHMNGVLRAYMHAVLAKIIEREGDRDWKDRPI